MRIVATFQHKHKADLMEPGQMASTSTSYIKPELKKKLLKDFNY